MTKLIILVNILLLNLLSFSQTAINNDTLVCLPKSVAKKIAIDLTKKDINDSTIFKLNRDIKLLDKKLTFKDSIMSTQTHQISLYKTNESLFTQSDEHKNKEITNLTLSLKKQKQYTTFSLIGTQIVLMLTIYFLK
jgi:hypothetical protein